MDIDRPPDVIVVAGGAPVGADRIERGAPRARVVAADSGVALALGLGLEVDVAIGDFDSLDPDLLARIDDHATEVRRYPAAKAATDLALALGVAVEWAPCRVLVLGLEGGRPDHALANLLLAAAAVFASLEIELVLEHGRAWVVRDRLSGSLPRGGLLSVIPVHGAATVSLTGLRWPLDHHRIDPGSTHGVSNEVVDDVVTVWVHDGTTICIHPRTTENP